MTVADLIRVLQTLPSEYAGLPVVTEYRGDRIDLDIVVLDPFGSMKQHSRGVYLCNRQDEYMSGVLAVRKLIGKTDAPQCGVCPECVGTGKMTVSDWAHNTTSERCAACGGTGKMLDPPPEL